MTRTTPIASEKGARGASGGLLLAARLCLSAVFLYSGATKFVFLSDGIAEFAALGLPMPALVLAATILLQFGAGLALTLGWRSGLAALALAVFTLPVTSHHMIADNLGFTAIYSRFFAGDFMRDAGPARDIDFVELTLQFKF